MKNINKEIEYFLEGVRTKHARLHKKYEEAFWVSYMGDHTVDKSKQTAQKNLDAFTSDCGLLKKSTALLSQAHTVAHKRSLQYWKDFFALHQTPKELVSLREKITRLEDTMQKKMAQRKEGYRDPYTKKWIRVSYLYTNNVIRTHDDEEVRKACFESTQKLATTNLTAYVQYVALLNEYARALGHEDFYAFKLLQEEGMTKKELFTLFESLYKKTSYAFTEIRRMEKKQKGLRKPWNYQYMLAGDFKKEEDHYFPFGEALSRWGRSFTALGVDFKKGTLQLDLLDRKGKYANGFCHWPTLVQYVKGVRIPGKANFTCTVVLGQIGEAENGYRTLFHEGGHAAHLLNTAQKDTCLNHEYPPMSTAWAETQSMFLETVFASYEWKSRYAQNTQGKTYPFDLYARKMTKLNALSPLSMHRIMMIATFEKEIYEAIDLTPKKAQEIARRVYATYTDQSADSLSILNVLYLYSWTSACSYHAYGLAEMALYQWRAYFKKKYGYIVDNKKVGAEMRKVWKLGASMSFRQFVIEATGKKLSVSSWTKEHTKSIRKRLADARCDAQRLALVRETKKINLQMTLRMVHGIKVVSTTRKSFTDMSEKYAQWLITMGFSA